MAEGRERIGTEKGHLKAKLLEQCLNGSRRCAGRPSSRLAWRRPRRSKVNSVPPGKRCFPLSAHEVAVRRSEGRWQMGVCELGHTANKPLYTVHGREKAGSVRETTRSVGLSLWRRRTWISKEKKITPQQRRPEGVVDLVFVQCDIGFWPKGVRWQSL